MRIFVTGASGWIGSAVVPELIDAGHRVLGLARSDASAAAVAALGAEVQRGDLDDLDSIRAGAVASEGVVHLGYHHDFTRMEAAAATDRAVIDTVAEVLEGTGRPFFIASGMAGLASDGPATEETRPDPAVHPRVANSLAVLDLAGRGIRSGIFRFPPTVHGPGDHGFVARLVAIARERGSSAYIDEGANRWPAVHRLDAARLVRLAVDGAPAGSVLHVGAEDGVATRAIAEAIGRGLGLPIVSVPGDRAFDHFDWMAMFFGMDCAASSTATRAMLGWNPTHPGLIEDLEAGSYFRG